MTTHLVTCVLGSRLHVLATYALWWRTYIQRRTHFVTYVFRRCIYSGDVRILAINIRILATDVRILLTYVFYQRTYSGDVHFDDVRVPVTYAFPWRTYFGDVRVMATYVFLTIYIYYRRTYSIDVRDSWTYVSSLTYVIS